MLVARRALGLDQPSFSGGSGCGAAPAAPSPSGATAAGPAAAGANADESLEGVPEASEPLVSWGGGRAGAIGLRLAGGRWLGSAPGLCPWPAPLASAPGLRPWPRHWVPPGPPATLGAQAYAFTPGCNLSIHTPGCNPLPPHTTPSPLHMTPRTVSLLTSFRSRKMTRMTRMTPLRARPCRRRGRRRPLPARRQRRWCLLPSRWRGSSSRRDSWG
jgi:hypothetical protein